MIGVEGEFVVEPFLGVAPKLAIVGVVGGSFTRSAAQDGTPGVVGGAGSLAA